MNLPIHKWSGVYLNDNNCVTKLDLSNKNLSGTIPSEIYNFTKIKHLDLSENNLSGVVLRHLTNLRKKMDTLNLANNQFTEELANDVRFESNNLSYLNLSHNNFSGDYSAFFSHEYLSYLNIANNQFTGQLPYLSGPKEVYAQNNLFTGEIPYYSFYSNRILNLSGNQFSGEIPHQLRSSDSLSYLNLENNLLTGCFYEKLRKFCDATVLLNGGNNFEVSWDDFCTDKTSCVDPSCTLSDSLNLIAFSQIRNCYPYDTSIPLTDWSGIELNTNNCVIRIDFNEEELRCDFIPPEIGNFSKLETLIIRKNHMKGAIPPEIGKLTQLRYLNLESNELAGKIPEEISNLVNLEQLHLSENFLSGPLPENIGNLVNLRKLYINYNNLSSNLPPSIGNLTKLNSLFLSFNNLSGPLPPSIGNLQHLEKLSIIYNKLSGSIPNELLNMDSLKLVDASNNHFSGCFNKDLLSLCDKANFDFNQFDGSWYNFCNFGVSTCDETYPCASNDSLSLLSFYQSVNGLSWDITKPISTWEGVILNNNGCVKELILPGKNLSGEISTQFYAMTYLNKVDLSNNMLDLKTTAPFSSESSNLEILDLSNNVIQVKLSSFGYKLKNLKYLDLSNNLIYEPSFDRFINFTNMEYLDLSHNNLEGSFNVYESDFVYHMPELYYFNIAQNNLNGDFPNSFLNLCERLPPSYNSNTYVSDGNSFNSTWEEFCDNQTSNNCPNNMRFPDTYPYIFHSHQPDSIIYENTYEAQNGISIYLKVAPNAKVTCKANEAITLGLGTSIDASTDFSATIGACQ